MTVPDAGNGGPEQATGAPRRRTLLVHLSLGAAWLVGGVLLLVLAIVGGVWWYSTTADFQRRVGREVVSVLADATGGQVELRALSFSLWHLAIEVDGLTIHGLEGPGEAPYLSAKKIQVRVQILSFLSHASGTGLASHIGLAMLRVEHPQIHLIVDKDGKTNQPSPKHPSRSKEPLQDTLLDLKAKEVALVDGVALVNDRAIPFELTGRGLEAQVHYLRTLDRYGIAVQMNDLRTRMAAKPEAQSRLRLDAELGRDMAELKSFEFNSGDASVLTAHASIAHFAKPEWQAALDGSLDLKQLSVLAGLDGFTGGSVDLVLRGHNCQVTPAVAQTRPRFWQRHLPPPPAKPGTTPLPPDPECQAGYLLVGNAKAHKVGYENSSVRLQGVEAGAELHITPSELLLTALSGALPGGGSANGELRIVDWLGEQAPASASRQKPVETAHAYLAVTADRIPLRTIMEATETNGYGDLGFDTAISGPLKAEWGGPVVAIGNSVEVDGNLKFTPTGVSRKGALNNIPVSGEAVAHYDGHRDVVNIEHIVLLTPQSTTEATGILGVNHGDRLTALKVDMSVRDLGEFDQLLQTLGFEANGKKGTAAVPVVLHGGLVFHGTASGPMADLDVKGHLQGTQLEVKLGTQADTLIDSLVADAEYSFDEGLAVASSTIRRGSAVLSIGGSMKPRKVVSRKGVATYLWDDGTEVSGTVKLGNASVEDVLQIAGQQAKYPVTGTIATDARVDGTLGNLNGQGTLTLNKGVAYGEAYDSIAADFAVKGQDLEASRVTVSLHGMQVAGNGGYDLASKRLHAHLAGNGLVLSKFQTVAKAEPNLDGTLSLVADADGTLEQPGLQATLKLASITVDGKAAGDLAAEVHSEGSLAKYQVQSKLIGAQVDVAGQTDLTGSYQTQAQLTLAGLDVGKAMAMFGTTNLAARSVLGGTVTVSGPLKSPESLVGRAEFNPLDVKLEGVELKSVGPVRLSLKDGRVSLDEVHVTGQDTDMQASGTVQAFGAAGPTGGKLDVKANGSISVALAHTFDPDILSSGKVEFAIAAGGTVKKPSLKGKIQFDNVNAAIDGIPNGLSALNGTLVFNEDRLNVESLTATTGGGQLKIGGFLTYSNGIYADLTATGDVVRVRLYGLSSTANTSLRLQGGPQSLLLSGNVLITRFGVGPDVDFAAFTSAGGVSAPPDPNAASNKIQLNVHVTSSPQLDFQNSYAKLAGNVDLTVRGTVAEPSILGRIQITDGSATFASTKYELQRGNIYFANPVRIDPIIDIDATARVENYDVTVGVHGTASNFKMSYRSEPPLSEADVFNLLALGRTQEEAQLYQEQQVQQGTDPTTSALLGGALNATVSNRVGKLFGGGSVKIDPAFVGTLGNSSARITVQQQLTRQLSVTYATNVNSTAEQLIQGQYDLTPSVSIVVARDETGVFSAVYKIRRRYR